MTGASRSATLYDTCFQSIAFAVGVDGKNRIVWISTTDETFRTPEGLAVGDSLESVLGIEGRRIVTESGWAWYVPLASGWNAEIGKVVVADGSSSLVLGGQGDIPQDACILSLFKRSGR